MHMQKYLASRNKYAIAIGLVIKHIDCKRNISKDYLNLATDA